MNPLFFSSILFGSTSLILSILVLFFARNRTHRLWAIFNFFVAWWGLFVAALSKATTPETATFLLKIATIGGFLIPVTFCHFIFSYSGLKKKYFLLISYLLAFATTWLYIIDVIRSDLKKINSYYYLAPTDWTFHIVPIFFTFYALYGLFHLCPLLHTSPPSKITQIRYLVFATILGFISGALSHFLTVYGYINHPEWNIFVTAYTLIVTYAIFRHHLIDINIILRKGILYSLVISLTTFIYFIIIIFLEKIFQSKFGYSTFARRIITILVIILCFEPMRIWFKYLLDQYFFKGSLAEIVNERELLKKEIQKQEQLRVISTLAAGLAHEIKNPMTSIKTFVEYLPLKYDDPFFRDKFTRIITDETARVNDIINRLLDFSKPSLKEMASLDLFIVLNDILDFLNSNFLKNRIELLRNYPKNLSVCGDKNQLRQVFLNIILNAIQAMPHGGRLIISGSSNLASTVIKFQDTGAGISKENLSQIFNPFFTTKESGTGLGLSIVHGIIQEHGGNIEVESEAGKGTTVSVILRSLN